LYEGGIIFEHGQMLGSELKAARSADKVSLDWHGAWPGRHVYVSEYSS
jgi:hypothetical protein